ncbi:MAG: TorF family putative porin [Woeseiaceae bacterium]
MKALSPGILLLLLASTANADFSANLGVASDYYFRGIFQSKASANGGVDFESGGFYAGVWAADVGGDIAGDGLEVDGYFGYGFDVGEVSLGVGFTGYYYTGDFDDTYEEINLSAGYGWLTVDAAIGKYDDASGPSLDYQFYSATLEHNGFWGQYGTFQDSFSGDYLQLGYDFSLVEFDFSFSLLLTDDNAVGAEEQALIFSVGKSFDLN